jgi:hypothetical protein
MLNYILSIYRWVIDVIQQILIVTSLVKDPEFIRGFSEAFSILLSATVVYLILTIFQKLKGLVRIFITVGWALLLVCLVVKILAG